MAPRHERSKPLPAGISAARFRRQAGAMLFNIRVRQLPQQLPPWDCQTLQKLSQHGQNHAVETDFCCEMIRI